MSEEEFPTTDLSRTIPVYGVEYANVRDMMVFLDAHPHISLTEVSIKAKVSHDVFLDAVKSILQRVEEVRTCRLYSRYEAVLSTESVFVVVKPDPFSGADMNRGANYSVKIYSPSAETNRRISEPLEDHFSDSAVAVVTWALQAPNGSIIYKDLMIEANGVEAMDEFYPWVSGGLDDFYRSYLSSPECVLLLAGPPGTGKTTFIKSMLLKNRVNTIITYDERLMRDDQFFMDFITGHNDVLVIEDADVLIRDRDTEKENVLSRLLNVSDGLVKSFGKKIIFTTNITDIETIDSALTRPGRCFAVMEFRKLNRSEAQAVLDAKGSAKQANDDRSYSLAELMSETGRTQRSERKRIGF